jgi:hypothetical protein
MTQNEGICSAENNVEPKHKKFMSRTYTHTQEATRARKRRKNINKASTKTKKDLSAFTNEGAASIQL